MITCEQHYLTDVTALQALEDDTKLRDEDPSIVGRETTAPTAEQQHE